MPSTPIPKVKSTSVTITSAIRKGTVRVAETRKGGPVDIHYELHGTGERKIMFISEFAIADRNQRLHKLTDNLYTAEWLSQPPTCSYAIRAMEQDAKDYKTNRDWAMDLIFQRRARSPAGHPAGTLPQLLAFNFHHFSPARLARIRDTVKDIMVVTGTVDDVMEPENSEYLAKQLHASYVVFEACGHSPFIERCDEANARLLEHIEKAHARFEKDIKAGVYSKEVETGNGIIMEGSNVEVYGEFVSELLGLTCI
ncbi:hypothetical protein HDU93_009650 [Gonapodya sp. JEL0774]|nr:hypothetical protein HDU93_009650 [Gonapodya sp. JEL0774]